MVLSNIVIRGVHGNIGHLAGRYWLVLLCGGPAADAATRKAPLLMDSPTKRHRMVVPDVQLMELDAGGIAAARADWTKGRPGFYQ